MIRLAVRRPVGTVVAWAALAAGGGRQLARMPSVPLPEQTARRLVVTADWPRGTPESIEAIVTSRVEAAARRVEGVRRVRSSSRRTSGGGARGTVELELEPSSPVERLRLSVAERLRSFRRELPDGVRLRLSRALPAALEEHGGPLLELHLTGPHGPALLGQVAEGRVRPALLSVDGVRDVRVSGGPEPRLAATPDRIRTKARGLGTIDVVEAARELGGPPVFVGSLDGAGGVPVFLRRGPGALAEARVGSAEGGRPARDPRLGDVVSLRPALAAPHALRRVRGRPAVSLRLFAERNVRAGRLSRRLRDRMADLAPSLPRGMELGVDRDRGAEWRRTAAGTSARGAVSLVAVALVSLLVLGGAGPAGVVLAAAGASLLGAVFVLGASGRSLDPFSLAGLVWGAGLVVDNALVVVELCRRAGSREPAPSGSATVAAARRAAPALAAGTATTIVCFCAMSAARPELAAWLASFVLASSVALGLSLAAALTLVPALVTLRPDRVLPRGRETGSSAGRGRAFPARSIEALAARPRTTAAAVALVTVGAATLVHDRVRRWPDWGELLDAGRSVVVDVRLERGARLGLMDAVARRLEAPVARRGSLDYRTRIEPAWLRLEVPLPRGPEGAAVGREVMATLAAAAVELDGVAVRVRGVGPGFRSAGASSVDYALEVTGPRWIVVRALGERLASRLAGHRRVTDVDPLAIDPWHRRGEAIEHVLRFEPVAMAAAGTSTEEAARLLRGVLRPRIPVGTIGGSGDPVVIDAPPRRGGRNAASALAAAGVGELEGVQGAIDARRRRLPPRIVRVDQRYRTVVTWRFAGPRRLGDRLRDRVVREVALPEGYRLRRSSASGPRREAERALRRSILLAALAVVLVSAAAVESWRTGLAALLAVPPALAGSGLALLVADGALTPSAYAGAGLTLGVTVNAAILVAHRAGELRREHGARAAAGATVERLPAVLATGATSVAGMLPFALAPTATGARLWASVSAVAIGGIAAGTLAAVTLVPAVLSLVDERSMRTR